jgi:hypothetical protein
VGRLRRLRARSGRRQRGKGAGDQDGPSPGLEIEAPTDDANAVKAVLLRTLRRRFLGPSTLRYLYRAANSLAFFVHACTPSSGLVRPLSTVCNTPMA